MIYPDKTFKKVSGNISSFLTRERVPKTGPTSINTFNSPSLINKIKISLYSNNYQISVPQHGNYSLKIFDLKGTLLASKNLNLESGKNSVTSNLKLSQGQYIAKISGMGVKSLQKLFVE